MSNVTQTIPSYIAGISQQPDEFKVPGQVNIATNVFPDITEGLSKRPGTRFIKQLDAAGAATDSQDQGKWFHYYRDETEQYLGQISRTGDINMWKCSDGSPVTVHRSYFASAATVQYLTHTNDQDLQLLTLNDYTYITNRTKVTSMTTFQAEATRPPEAFIELKKVAYANQYAVNLFDNTNKTTVTTATRIRVELVKSSNNYCDANGFMLDHASRNSATVRCDDSSGDGRDAYAPNVGTRIFSINHNSSLTDDSATGGVKADSSNTSTAYNYTVSVYNSSNQSGQTGRSNLYFRITTTGQSVPYTTGSGENQTTTYQARYTTTNDLLHGGEGWLTGDYFYVWLKDGYYKVIIEEISTSKVQANLGLIRPNPTSFDTKTTVTAESIIGAIRTDIVGTGNFTDANVQQIGNGLYITRSSNSFNVSSPVGELLNVLTDAVKDVADLPKQCKHGYVVKVSNSEAEEDDYYVKFFGNNDRDGEGVWEECAKPGASLRIEPSSMPLVLIRAANGSFLLTELDGNSSQVPGSEIQSLTMSMITTGTGVVTINNHGYLDNEEVYYHDGGSINLELNGVDVADGQKLYIDLIDANTFKLTTTSNGTGATVGVNDRGNNSQFLSNSAVTVVTPKWDNAQVGDTSVDGTNPQPSFIGKTINKMLFFRNRFVLLSDENVIMSRPGDFTNFWSKSAITFTATDPIDISCSSEYPAIIYDGIQVNSGLVLFTKNQQFMLTTDSDVLSPLTAKINFISAYNFNHNTNPFSLGTTIGFIDNVGQHSRLMEMARILREGEPDVIEQSKVVSELLDKDLNIVSTSKENGFVALSEKDKTTLYCYKFFNTSDKRVHQAWFTWSFHWDIQYHFIIDDSLYLVLDDDGKCMLIKLDLKLHSDTLQTYTGTSTDKENIHPVYLDCATEVAINDYMPTTPDATGRSWTRANSGNATTIINYTNHGYIAGQLVKVYLGQTVTLAVSANNLTANSFQVYGGNLAIGTSGTTDVTGQHLHYNASTNKTTFPLPTNWWTTEAAGGDMVLYETGGTDPVGRYTEVTINGSNVVVDGNWEGTTVVLGILYEMEVEFPKIYPTSQQGESVRSDTRGSLVLHRNKINLGASGLYQTILKRRGKPTFTEDHESVIADYSEESELPTQQLQIKVIPIYDRNTNTTLTLKSKHPTPLTLFSMTWEGDYTNKFYSSV